MDMSSNPSESESRFPELSDPEQTLDRIAEAFVAPEYARAAFALMREIVQRAGGESAFGSSVVITAPHDYSNLIMTISKWWFLNFHIAQAEALEEGDDVEEMVPLDYETVMERQKEDEADDAAEAAEVNTNGHDKNADADIEEFDEDELEEATFYQVGTFLLDSTIIPHETIFEREDLDCYAYDYPEERIEAERFYWARMVWEPEDLSNEDFLAALHSTVEFLMANHTGEVPYAEFQDIDFARLILDAELCERAIGATDFGDVIVLGGPEE
jgi:hypothetical protein